MLDLSTGGASPFPNICDIDDALRSQRLPRRPFVVQRTFRRKDIVNFFGDDHKAHFELGVSIADGGSFLGRKVRRGRALLVDALWHSYDISPQVDEMARSIDADANRVERNLKFIALRGLGTYPNLEELEQILRVVSFEYYSAILVNGIEAFESSPDTPTWQILRQIADRTGAAVVTFGPERLRGADKNWRVYG